MKLIFTIMVFLLTMPSFAMAQQTYASDEHGHAFATSFDRYNRLQLETSVVVDSTGSGPHSGPQLGGAYRFAFSADFPDEEIWWRLRHTVLDTQLRRAGDGWQTRMSLVDADYLRHDISSWITVPGDSDLRLPGPFDIVVRWELAAATFALNAPTEVTRWEFFELDFLLDFIRDENYRHRLAIGVTTDWELAAGERHEVAPLSAATALYGWESASGLFAARIEARLARMVMLTASEEPTWRTHARANAFLEWTPLAINDRPIAFVASGSVKADINDAATWEFTLGGRLSL